MLSTTWQQGAAGSTDGTSSTAGHQPPASELVRKALLQRQLQLAQQEVAALRTIVSLQHQELQAGPESAAFDAGYVSAYAGEVKDRLAKAVAKGRLDGKELQAVAEDVQYVITTLEEAVGGLAALLRPAVPVAVMTAQL
jgi:hypothetical protein